MKNRGNFAYGKVSFLFFFIISNHKKYKSLQFYELNYLLREKYILGRKYVKFLYDMMLTVTVPLDMASMSVLLISISI